MANILYLPRMLSFEIRSISQLHNVDPESISGETIFMSKDNERKVPVRISLNKNNDLIHVMPLEPYEEGSLYKIVFLKDIKLKQRRQLDKNFYFIFRIINATIVIGNANADKLVRQSYEKTGLPDYSDLEHINHHIEVGEISDDTDTSDDEEVEESIGQEERKKSKKFLLLPLIIIIGIAAYLLIKDQAYKNEVRNALSTGMSTRLAAGSVLSQTDEYIEARDVTILHDSDEQTTKLYVWDYAAEDGDTVQIYVNGRTVTEEMVIQNEPFEFECSSEGVFEVRGIYDGGGGITYAVYCDLDKTTYLNNAPVGGSNRYTVTRTE